MSAAPLRNGRPWARRICRSSATVVGVYGIGMHPFPHSCALVQGAALGQAVKNTPVFGAVGFDERVVLAGVQERSAWNCHAAPREISPKNRRGPLLTAPVKHP